MLSLRSKAPDILFFRSDTGKLLRNYHNIRINFLETVLSQIHSPMRTGTICIHKSVPYNRSDFIQIGEHYYWLYNPEENSDWGDMFPVSPVKVPSSCSYPEKNNQNIFHTASDALHR